MFNYNNVYYSVVCILKVFQRGRRDWDFAFPFDSGGVAGHNRTLHKYRIQHSVSGTTYNHYGPRGIPRSVRVCGR